MSKQRVGPQPQDKLKEYQTHCENNNHNNQNKDNNHDSHNKGNNHNNQMSNNKRKQSTAEKLNRCHKTACKIWMQRIFNHFIRMAFLQVEHCLYKTSVNKIMDSFGLMEATISLIFLHSHPLHWDHNGQELTDKHTNKYTYKYPPTQIKIHNKFRTSKLTVLFNYKQ